MTQTFRDLFPTVSGVPATLGKNHHRFLVRRLTEDQKKGIAYAHLEGETCPSDEVGEALDLARTHTRENNGESLKVFSGFLLLRGELDDGVLIGFGPYDDFILASWDKTGIGIGALPYTYAQSKAA